MVGTRKAEQHQACVRGVGGAGAGRTERGVERLGQLGRGRGWSVVAGAKDGGQRPEELTPTEMLLHWRIRAAAGG